MNSWKKLAVTLFLSAFASVLFFLNSFCQETVEELFLNGKNSQQEAEKSLEKSFRMLEDACAKCGLTITELANFFEAGEITLSRFFDELGKKYDEPETFQKILTELTGAQYNFESALKAYDTAISLNQSIVDAYIKKASIYAEMHIFEEALLAYRKAAEEIGFSHLTEIDLLPLENQLTQEELIGGELTKVAKQIARLCSERLNPLQEPTARQKESKGALVTQQKAITPDEILEPLFRARIERIEQLLSNAKNDEEQKKLSNLKVMNDFLFAEFYQEIGWKSEALNRYNKAEKEWQETFQNNPDDYSEAIRKTTELLEKIAAMKPTPIHFEIKGDLKVNIQLFRTPTAEDSFSPIISFSPSGSTVSFAGNITQKDIVLPITSERGDNYSLVITVPKIEVTTKDQMPFEVSFKWRSEKGEEVEYLFKNAQEIVFDPIASEKPLHQLHLSRAKDDFTYDSQTYHLLNNRTKQRHPIDEGNYKVRVFSEILLRSDPNLSYTITITPIIPGDWRVWIARIIVVAMGLSYLRVR
jgi:tetratricopeptide (TPR) repeat protein